jgi:hypothetical protein
VSTVFVDTSGWIALLSRDDRFHGRALSRYDELANDGSRLLTNNYVVDETATRLRYGLGLAAALDFGLRMRPRLRSTRFRRAARFQLTLWGLPGTAAGRQVRQPHLPDGQERPVGVGGDADLPKLLSAPLLKRRPV